jgi:hypothetical protein
MHTGLQVAGGAVLLLAVVLGVSAMTAADPAPERSAHGPTYVTSQGAVEGFGGPAAVTKVSATGEVAWKRAGDVVSYHGVATAELPNGTRVVLVSYLERTDTGCGPYASPCGRTGWRMLDVDNPGRVYHDWWMPVRSGKFSEIHDVEYLPDRDAVLVADMDRERIFTVKRESGEIDWQWNASELYTPPADPTRRDWLHINDVDRIGPGRYLVSVRNANQLLVMTRSVGVTEVINRDQDPADDGDCRTLGHELVGEDVRCGDRDLLDHQHNPQWLGEGRILVADSEGNRVVEIQRRSDGSWREAWSVDSAGGVPLRWPRDADRLPNGHTLITDTRNDRIVQVNRSGRLVWSHSVNHSEPYAAIRNGTEYPAGPPVESASAAGGSFNVAQLDRLYRTVDWFLRLPAWFGELQFLASLVAGVVVLWGLAWPLVCGIRP